MAGNERPKPNKPAPDSELAKLQAFLLDTPAPTRRPEDLSVAELEALLAQKRREEARNNHRRLRGRQADQTAVSLPPLEPPALPVPRQNETPPVAPTARPASGPVDKLSPARFEPVSMVAQKPRRSRPVATEPQVEAAPRKRATVSGLLNLAGYTLETLVVLAALLLLGNWALQQAGIALRWPSSTGIADFAVAPSRAEGIFLNAQAPSSIQLPPTATPVPPTPTEMPVNGTPRPRPTATPVPVVAVAPTPTPAIVQPKLQSLAEGAAPPPRPPKRLIIPKIGVDSPVVEVTVDLGNWQVADNAIGHHLGTATPGQPGNMVLVGHRDIRGSLFLRLNEMQVGDEFKVISDNGVFQYQVTSISEVAPTDVAVMNPTVDPTATLITCTPIGLATKRLIVKARLEK